MTVNTFGSITSGDPRTTAAVGIVEAGPDPVSAYFVDANSDTVSVSIDGGVPVNSSGTKFDRHDVISLTADEVYRIDLLVAVFASFCLICSSLRPWTRSSIRFPHGYNG